MVDEIDVHKKADFLFRKATSYPKETSTEGFSAAVADGLREFAPVVGSRGRGFQGCVRRAALQLLNTWLRAALNSPIIL